MQMELVWLPGSDRVMLVGDRENTERSEHIWLRGIESKDK